MRRDARLRALWRHVDASAPASDARLERLAARIEREAERALRRRPYSGRAAMWIGAAAALLAAIAVTLMPPQPPTPAATLIEAVSGREIPDGATVVAAAMRGDRTSAKDQ